uniref:Reverse transcriptase/retrotransposon-derived protein RNase H-like domain-containing protein n=1 Tax=Timema tahoe TaxID=61484 RepID=A0A7R9IJS8_9NEOP|nr:unnamed protein product [Timema tahoe]
MSPQRYPKDTASRRPYISSLSCLGRNEGKFEGRLARFLPSKNLETTPNKATSIAIPWLLLALASSGVTTNNLKKKKKKNKLVSTCGCERCEGDWTVVNEQVAPTSSPQKEEGNRKNTKEREEQKEYNRNANKSQDNWEKALQQVLLSYRSSHRCNQRECLYGSSVDLGAVLFQRTLDGVWLVAFAAKTLANAEKMYSAYEKEYLTCSFVVEKFANYLE